MIYHLSRGTKGIIYTKGPRAAPSQNLSSFRLSLLNKEIDGNERERINKEEKKKEKKKLAQFKVWTSLRATIFSLFAGKM